MHNDYISDTLLKWVDKIHHTPCSVSDHYFVDVHFKDIDLQNFKYGPGRILNLFKI